MMLTAGTKLGPYTIESPIGAGGMGEVYRARDTRLGREVAIKILPQHLASEAESEIGPGPLYASGLIAGGGIFGLLGILIYLFGDPNFKYHFLSDHFLQIGPSLLGGLAKSRIFAVVMFVLLGASQFYYARKKMD